MNWRVKALVQKALGVVPGGPRIHHLLQRYLGGLRHFEEECRGKIEDWKNFAHHVRTAGVPLAGARMLEIGTGWYPTLPFCSYLAGAASVITVDLERHLQPDLTRRCARLLGECLGAIAELGAQPLSAVAARHARLQAALEREEVDLADATEGCIDYRAPADATESGLPAGSVDIVFSNSVLEHVPPETIARMMRESRRLLRPGGVMFHSVNCGDHYSYFDPSVTQLNYLRYSEPQWRIWNSRFLYQNRLRARDFTQMAEEEGFEIVVNTAHPTEQRRAELRRIPVAKCFQHYPPDELCITTIDFVARKP